MPDITPRLGLKKPLGNEVVSRAAYNENIDLIDQNAAQASDFTAHLADYVRQPGYATATGSANTYALSLDPVPTAYVDGMAVSVKINIDNTGASTIDINSLGAKTIKKANGSDISAGNLKAGSIYPLRYNGTNFILQGEGGEYGTAQAAQVLSGYTIGTDTGLVTGTMTNRGQVIITPSTSNQTITQGYHSGTGYVVGDSDLVSGNIKAGVNLFGVAGKSTVKDVADTTMDTGANQLLTGYYAYSADGIRRAGAMPNSTQNITPGVGNVTITAGWHSGAGVVYGDEDLVAGNILSGKNIFGVAGSAEHLRDRVILIGDMVVESMSKSYDLRNDGTWVSSGSSDIARYMRLVADDDYVNISDVVVSTVSAIDLTPYTKLRYNFSCGDRTAQVGIGTSRTDANLTVYTSVSGSGSHALCGYLDISIYNGLYYIKLRVTGTDGFVTGQYAGICLTLN